MQLTLKQWVAVGTFALTVAGGAFAFKVFAGDTKEAKTLAKQNAEINQKLSALIIESNAKLRVYLELHGFDQDKARAWAAIPRRPTVDSNNIIVPDKPWLNATEDLRVGALYVIKITDSARLYVDTLWDLREEKK